MYKEQTIDFGSMTDDEVKRTLQEYRIALTEEEILKIQKDILKRPPTLTEAVLWSIQGSEHSSYKSSRPFLKQFVTDAPNVILGPSEDAGIVEVARDKEGKRYGIVVSHESHNKPSQVVPYEGAATGVGGNVRDVSCMGAKVIGILDSLRFGDIGRNKTKWIHEGVVAGIAGYGNPIGVPNIGGDVYYDESYNDNCLVNVVTLGVLCEDEIIHSYVPPPLRTVLPLTKGELEGVEDKGGSFIPYNFILVGKPTDNSGFGGASFASLELKEEEKEANKGAVQEPNAFLKRHLLKATYTLFKLLKERGLLSYVGLKDLGAGGIACATVELADSAGLGAEINLDEVFVGMEGLHPSVILCSETQERYMWVASPSVTSLIVEHYNKTYALGKVSKGAQAKVIGKVRADGKFVVRYKGAMVVDARARDVTRGLEYKREYRKPEKQLFEPELKDFKSTKDLKSFHHFNDILLCLLSHENIASRQPIYEKYDKNVQGISVVEAGIADSSIIQPFKDDEFPEEIRECGIAVSLAHNPRYGKIDPYWCGVNAVVEAMRNVVAVGAVPQALTDCLNFGNPEKPEQMGEFVEAVRGVAEAAKNLHLKEYPQSPVPIISGNVSFYNRHGDGAIAPSPIVCCIGKLKDVSKVITKNFKEVGSALFMVGERRDECGGSVYYSLFSELGASVPKPQFQEVENQIFALTDAIEQGLILSAHDISDGGIAVTLTEMSFGSEIGCGVIVPGNLSVDKLLFSETGGFVIEVKQDKIDRTKKVFKDMGVEIYQIGSTTKEKRLRFNDCIDLALREAKKAWDDGLRQKLQG